MAKVVNLNRYRKKRTRDDREKTAEANRAQYGRTKEERQKARFEQQNREAELAAKRLDDGHDKDGLEDA